MTFLLLSEASQLSIGALPTAAGAIDAFAMTARAIDHRANLPQHSCTCCRSQLPSSQALQVEKRAARAAALLLHHHGSMIAGATVAAASALAERGEVAARLFLAGGLGQAKSGDRIAKLRSRFT